MLHLQDEQPWHPTICILGHAVDVSPGASGPQRSCNNCRQVREGQEKIEISDLGSYFPWAQDVCEKHHAFLVKRRDLATQG